MTAEAFLARHIRALSERYEVDLVANADPESLRHPDLQQATRIRARIEREIAPFADLRALLQLIAILRRGNYSLVHSMTPKAGLLTALAAFIARVPVRVHTYTGQVWSTRRGFGRWLLKALDRIIAKLDTNLFADGFAQLDFLRAEGVLDARQGSVLASGSTCGVDAGRFRSNAEARDSVRRELTIPAAALVFLFVGRLTRDKGVLDLARAFAGVAAADESAYLVLVGPDEDALGESIRSACGAGVERARFAGFRADPERYMAAADVFCLPSHREGFSIVALEAAAAGLPAIGSRIYGIVDAIEDGVGGLLFEPHDVGALSASMQRLGRDPALREHLAHAARERALRDFSQDRLTVAFVEFYESVVPSTSPSARQAARSKERSRFD